MGCPPNDMGRGGPHRERPCYYPGLSFGHCPHPAQGPGLDQYCECCRKKADAIRAEIERRIAAQDAEHG